MTKAYSLESNLSNHPLNVRKVSDIRRKFTNNFHPNFLNINNIYKKDNIKKKAEAYKKKVEHELVEAARDQFIANVKKGHKVSLQ